MGRSPAEANAAEDARVRSRADNAPLVRDVLVFFLRVVVGVTQFLRLIDFSVRFELSRIERPACDTTCSCGTHCAYVGQGQSCGVGLGRSSLAVYLTILYYDTIRYAYNGPCTIRYWPNLLYKRTRNNTIPVIVSSLARYFALSSSESRMNSISAPPWHRSHVH